MTLRRITATVALFFLAAAITFVLLGRWDEALVAIIVAAVFWVLWMVLEHRTQRQWFVWPVAITLGMIGSGIATSTPAQAAEYGSGQNEVCAYLDARPNVAGVEDLIGIAVHNGMTGYDAGTVIAQAVVNYCPRHLPTLDAYIAKWG